MNASVLRRIALATTLAVLMLGLTGCFAFRRVETAESRLRTESKTISKMGVTELNARFQMPVGILSVDGETGALAEMEFRSTNRDWLPLVSTSESQGASGTVTELDVAVPQSFHLLPGNNKYEWDVHLASDVAGHLRFELGAGESTLDLREMDVRELSVKTGVGETRLDLSGSRTHDLAADIECGIGELVVQVPGDIGVRISGREQGIGGFAADGFTLDGDSLTNDAWDNSQVRIDITLRRGIGDVHIETVE